MRVGVVIHDNRNHRKRDRPDCRPEERLYVVAKEGLNNRKNNPKEDQEPRHRYGQCCLGWISKRRKGPP